MLETSKKMKNKLISFLANPNLVLALHAILIFFITIPGTRIIYKYFPAFSTTLSITYIGLVYFSIFLIAFSPISDKIRKLLGNPLLIVSILFLICLVTYLVYPIADGLKYQMRGSDQDDCVILGTRLLSNLQNPYLSRSYFGNPCSPGPGVLIPHLPFALIGIYELVGPLSIILLTTLLRLITNSWKFVGTFLIMFLSCILILELLVVGSDLIFIGCGILASVLILMQAAQFKKIGWLITSAIVCGLISSTRVNFIVLIPIFSFFVYIYWRKSIVYFVLITAVIAFLPATLIYLNNPSSFTPLHLLKKSQAFLSPVEYYAATFFSLVCIFLSLIIIKQKISMLPCAIFIALFPSLFFVSMGDLIYHCSWNVADWEGANYLIPLVPLAAFLITFKIFAMVEKMELRTHA
ncbi:putative membrane protein [Leptospira inadai serovar Lyme str. 10]|uniref:PF09594 family protein n=3 Tax=Leptospira inadai TaxID=29506 RepID=A0ABX4YLV6_9LEPT|nr:putative membrane protein [Leptospira inadai serovar Lyme str. 10]PNV76155.1 hypothetical protein BES34_003865 [Leptospira inadai serovar Lyme]